MSVFQSIHVVVSGRRDEAENICSFELVPIEDGKLPDAPPGSHIEVEALSGLWRPYSLCGDPADRSRWRIAVLREHRSRGGSAGMHEAVRMGMRLRVSLPKDRFPLTEAPHSLLIAGGIGITPILAMAYALHGRGGRFDLHYCTRSTARTAFRQELEEVAFAGHVHMHVGDDPRCRHFDASQILGMATPDTHLYVCGPPGFMGIVLTTARDLGWTEHRLHHEPFGTMPHRPTAPDTDAVFEVRLARSGRTLTIPANRTVLDVLLAAGVAVPYSCEAGVCGTCMTRVIKGTPDHRDSYLTAAERAVGDKFMPCCSRAQSSQLVLDL